VTTSADRAVYLDSSAIVKLVVAEPESAALRAHLRSPASLVSSALARTEVQRSVAAVGPAAQRRALDVLRRLELIRIGDQVLDGAGTLEPPGVHSLDAIHLATAGLLGDGLAHLVTYDRRMADAATALGIEVVAPR